MDVDIDRRRWRTGVLWAWVALLILAWGLWLWQLESSDLTFDEAATYFVAHRPPRRILVYLRQAIREHPPLYYLLIHVWMALAGTSVFSLRLFSAGAGLVALALTGWLARQVWRRAPAFGLSAALFLALMPGMAYYAREARMYTLCVVWGTLASGLFIRDWLPVGARPARKAWGMLVGVHLLAIFTHYYLVLPILAQPLVLLVCRRWHALRRWLALHVTLVLAALAWFRAAQGLQRTTAGIWYSFTWALPAWSQVSYLLGKLFFSPVVRLRPNLLYPLLALSGAGAALILWRRRAVGAWGGVTLLGSLGALFVLPHLPEPRYVLFLSPLFALTLAAAGRLLWRSLPIRGVAWAARGGLTLGVGALLVAGGLGETLTFERSRYGRTLATVQARARPGDAVLFYGPWQWIQYAYYQPETFPPTVSLPPYAPPRLRPTEAEPVLARLWEQYERLWVLPAAVADVDPERFVYGWLRTYGHEVWRDGAFRLYLPRLPEDAPCRAVDATFGSTLTLERVAFEGQMVPAGEPLRLTLHWQPLERLPEDVLLTLRLVDRHGHVWDERYPLPGEWAAPPSTWAPGQVFEDHEGLMVPQGAPPGPYTVRLGVAGVDTGRPLAAPDGRELVDLVTVQVVDPVLAPVLVDLPNRDAAQFCAPAGDPCLALAGYEPGGLRFSQGQAALVTLHWLVPDSTPPDVELRLRVASRGAATPVVSRTLTLPREWPVEAAVSPLPHRVFLPLTVAPSAGVRPAERLLTLPTALALPPDAPTGRAAVQVAVVGPEGDRWRTPAGEETFSLFPFTLEGRPVQRRLPRDVRAADVDFGAEVGLRGYRLAGDFRPGGEVRVTYFWYAREQPTMVHAVFNHLVDAQGEPVAQVDGWPQGGRMLSIQWQEEEYVEDQHVIPIPAGAPSGPYILRMGMYNAADGVRFPAFEADQRLSGDYFAIPVPAEGAR
jgi:hypothetical protein